MDSRFLGVNNASNVIRSMLLFRSRPRRRREPVAEMRELEIARMGRRGDGIADLADRSVYVPYALPGETVRAEVRGERGRLLKVLSPAANRVPAPCLHFGCCGGCAIQHIADVDYRAWKLDLVRAALSRRGLAADVPDLIDAHGSGRRRVSVHARRLGGRVFVGFMRVRDHKLRAVDHCLLLTPGLHSVFDMSASMVAALDLENGEVNLHWTETKNGLDCDLRHAGDLSYDRQVALADAAHEYDLARVTWNTDIVVERRAPYLHMGSAQVVAAPGGFLQATVAGEEMLSDLVLSSLINVQHIADLYCGIGPFALRLAQTARIYAADGNADAVAALDRAARHTPNLKPVTAAVRDLARDPLTPVELSHFEAVIFDPPRAGALNQAKALADADVPLVIAVSCDPETFARDARALVDGGYGLDWVCAIDQFRYTAHVEIVGVFRRPA